jgi:hypothetical protein
MGMRSILLLSSVCLASGPPARAGDPSASDLIKLAPAISSTDRSYQSIAVSGSMKGERIHLRFLAIYQAPDRHAFLITDGADGTPLILVAEHQMLIYDPVRPAVLRMKNARSQLMLRKVGNESKLNYTFGASSRESESSELTLDFRSTCEVPAVEERAVKDGEGRYRLFRTCAEGATSVYSVDRSRKMPYTGLKTFPKDSHEASLSIDRIEVDVVLKDEEFRLPDMARLAEKIAIDDPMSGGFMHGVGGVATMTRAYEARLGANHPGVRKSVRFAGLKGIHWDQVRENDRKFSTLMKELLPPEPVGPRPAIELPPLPPLPPDSPRQVGASPVGPALR